MSQKQNRVAYARIRSYQQLVAANKELEIRIEAQKTNLKSGSRYAREFYTFSHIIQYVVDSLKPVVDLAGFVVDVVNGIAGKRRRRKAAKEDAQLSEDAIQTPVEEGKEQPVEKESAEKE